MESHSHKSSSPPFISIIIRTKNEERWIGHCLHSVFQQSYRQFEVILVDNESTDRTVEKARQFPLTRVVSCSEYLPGKALNAGIRAAQGQYVVCLSGHCIPVTAQWLMNLVRNFCEPDIAGVYGRQEPMSFTPDTDKRDLAVVFGLDRKVQVRDSFFHNANSMLRRDLWEQMPFDEQVTNIEDRVWGQAMIRKGYKLIYEPEASVYHHHGIHQNGNVERCANVVRIMEQLHDGLGQKPIDVDKLLTVALIPIRGPTQELRGKPLVAYTIERALAAKYIRRVVVSTDNPEIASIAKAMGAEAPFLRDEGTAQEFVDLARVLQYSLEQLEARHIFPDVIVSLEATFPFRPCGLLDAMILQLAKSGFDSLMAVRREYRALWKEKNCGIIQLEEGLTPRQLKDPTFVELRGVGCISHPDCIRSGQLLGRRVGMYEVNNPYSHLEVRSAEDVRMASHLVQEFFP